MLRILHRPMRQVLPMWVWLRWCHQLLSSCLCNIRHRHDTSQLMRIRQVPLYSHFPTMRYRADRWSTSLLLQEQCFSVAMRASTRRQIFHLHHRLLNSSFHSIPSLLEVYLAKSCLFHPLLQHMGHWLGRLPIGSLCHLLAGSFPIGCRSNLLHCPLW